jgi:hypothetical protein
MVTGFVLYTILEYATGYRELGDSSAASSQSVAADQAELNDWVTSVHTDALASYGVDSWQEHCDGQSGLMLDEMAETGGSDVTWWACFDPRFTATGVGELDVHLDTYSEETAEDAAANMMSIIGATREDLDSVNVYDSGGGLLGYKLRSQVPAL